MAKLNSSTLNLHVLLFCLLGLIVRIFFALIFHPWNLAPDQLAWEVLLQEGSFSYAQLIHYPHEGGSILVSLISKFFLLFGITDSLVISALLIDAFSRLIQLSVIHQLFDKKIFYAFGIWQIFSLPFILPWSSVNYGLHSLASFFPFLLLYLFYKYNSNKSYFILLGLFLGFAFWFHYSNISLIIPAFIFLLVKRTGGKEWLVSGVTLFIILGLHLIVRSNFDAGFHLTEYSISTIRGTSIEWTDPHTYKKLIKVYYQPLADLIISGVEKYNNIHFFKFLWGAFLLTGAFGFLKKFRTNKKDRALSFAFIVIPIFLALYALSPFYFDSTTKNPSNYVAYRHLNYIAPFLFLFVIIGFNQLKFNSFLSPLFISLCIISVGFRFSEQPKDFVAEEATGWVLANKMGHQPEIISNGIKKSNLSKDKLFKGVGWGTTSAIMPLEKTITLDNFDTKKIYHLYSIFNKYPEESSCSLMEGVFFAFSDYVQPQLEEKIFPKVLAREEILHKPEKEKSTSFRENSSNP